jgi:hypothetical protein
MHTLVAKFFALVFTFGPHAQAQHHSTAFVPPAEYASSIDYNIPSRHDILNGYGAASQQ